MKKKLRACDIDFADSELDSFKFYDQNSLVVYLNSWDEKKIKLQFVDVINFTYKLGFQISNFYEIDDNMLIIDSLIRNYEKIPPIHPYKLFQLEDIDDFPFIQVIAESVSIVKD